jgi:hypothetical protein
MPLYGGIDRHGRFTRFSAAMRTSPGQNSAQYLQLTRLALYRESA